MVSLSTPPRTDSSLCSRTCQSQNHHGLVWSSVVFCNCASHVPSWSTAETGTLKVAGTAVAPVTTPPMEKKQNSLPCVWMSRVFFLSGREPFLTVQPCCRGERDTERIVEQEELVPEATDSNLCHAHASSPQNEILKFQNVAIANPKSISRRARTTKTWFGRGCRSRL